MQAEDTGLLYCRMTVDNRPPPDTPVYRVRDVEVRIGELEDVLSSELYSFRSGQSLLREVRHLLSLVKGLERAPSRLMPSAVIAHDQVCLSAQACLSTGEPGTPVGVPLVRYSCIWVFTHSPAIGHLRRCHISVHQTHCDKIGIGCLGCP